VKAEIGDLQECWALPVTRYFVFVGSTLGALLLIVSWYCPAPLAVFDDRPRIMTTAAIRIKSERKWPEKIEFDTSQPTIAPPAGEAPPVAALPALPQPGETTGRPRFEALAQLTPDTRLTATRHRAVQIKRRLAGTSRSNRVARVPVVNRLARLGSGEACCQFGWTNNWQPRPNAVSRKHAMPLGSTNWLAFSER
jgi:hypothetical protein